MKVRMLVVLGVCVAAPACHDGFKETTVREVSRPIFPVDASQVVIPASTEERVRALAEAKRVMFDMANPDLAAVIRRNYELDNGARVTGVPGNKALADAFARVYALEDALLADEFDSFQKGIAFERSANVIIAVLDSMKPRNAKVVVLRTTVDDLSRNYILLRRDVVSREAIAAALRNLASSRRRFGDVPSKRVRSIIKEVRTRQRPLDATSSQQITNVLAGFATASLVRIPGYGEAPAVTITVGPVAREPDLSDAQRHPE